MRSAKSYSIVDHGLLHGGYFHRLSHQALALYLFLVVVGDREGKSFYAEQTIMEILRFTISEWKYSLEELIESGLIEYRRPYFWVKSLPADWQPGVSVGNLEKEKRSYGRAYKKDTILKRHKKVVVQTDRSRDWHTAREGVRTLLRHLGR